MATPVARITRKPQNTARGTLFILTSNYANGTKTRCENSGFKTREREPSFYELGLVALGPGVVGDEKGDPVGDGGVVVEEKGVDGIGVGVGENGFAPNLELARGGLAGVGNDAVSDFETVDIGLILFK